MLLCGGKWCLGLASGAGCWFGGVCFELLLCLIVWCALVVLLTWVIALIDLLYLLGLAALLRSAGMLVCFSLVNSGLLVLHCFGLLVLLCLLLYRCSFFLLGSLPTKQIPSQRERERTSIAPINSSRRRGIEAIAPAVSELERDLPFHLELAIEVGDENLCSLIDVVFRRATGGSRKRSTTYAAARRRHGRIVRLNVLLARSQPRPVVEAQALARRGGADHGNEAPPVHVEIQQEP
ncbi:hypothetical protein U1Q18_026512 [Sarracenia purpurea var. burkii]